MKNEIWTKQTNYRYTFINITINSIVFLYLLFYYLGDWMEGKSDTERSSSQAQPIKCLFVNVAISLIIIYPRYFTHSETLFAT